ncbi:histidinol-phosphate transaminase [Caldicellulosiruptor naganoensis]|uniref:Histidinol-phosphate transaminase n=1 Tax=Caldicellulosiruptor naganoensis TaxID=29324 RepID=A0ABY7BD06_9FIRM|nr:histidinol-phosphate transaminase [Caldicellulosiruptor naganoensis]WAM30494.1 histidinol-phosphate transaminase [Caldicellulosiruptor naganoensis]
MFRSKLQNFSNYSTPVFEYIVKADANENLLDYPEDLEVLITDVLKKNVRNLCFYPEINSQPLKQELAKFYGLKEENFIIGNGSDQIIQLIIQAACDKDDFIFTLYPSFAMYKITAELFDVNHSFLDITQNWEINADEVIEKISQNDKIKVIFIDTPNNPTGVALEYEKLKLIAESFPERLIVIDNAYGEYCDINYLDLALQEKNVILLKTFSKIGFAGIRCGYAIANEKVIENLHKVKPPYNVNILSQQIAISLLRNLDKLKSNIDLIKSERVRMTKCLEDFYFVLPSQANFISIVDDEIDYIFDYLKSKKILVKKFDIGMKKLLRITLGKPKDNDIILESLINYKRGK